MDLRSPFAASQPILPSQEDARHPWCSPDPGPAERGLDLSRLPPGDVLRPHP